MCTERFTGHVDGDLKVMIPGAGGRAEGDEAEDDKLKSDHGRETRGGETPDTADVRCLSERRAGSLGGWGQARREGSNQGAWRKSTALLIHQDKLLGKPGGDI